MRHIFALAHCMVEIANAIDPAITIISVKNKNPTDGCSIKTVDIRMPKEKEILADLIEKRIMLGKPASLPVSFLYHHQAGSASIRQIMERSKDRMQEFYHRL